MRTFLYHMEGGSPPCGDKAVEFVGDLKKIGKGTPAKASDFRHLDGTVIHKGDPMKCDSCGRPFAIAMKFLKHEFEDTDHG